MSPRILAGIVTSFAVVFTPTAQPLLVAAPAEPVECAALAKLELPDVKVTEAVAIPAPATGAVRVAHCRVNGVVGKEIRFTLLLPDTWNHKFVMGGGGGFVAGIDNQAVASVNTGYATVGTDTGHVGALTAAGWALNNPERQVNFGHLAVHRVAEVSKAIIGSHYGSNQTRSYFSGCSNGGRQALMEAQRYPEDFDGIVAGAPAYDFLGIGAQFIKDIQAAFPDPANISTPMFSNELLKSVEAQIVDKCDALDGVKDGLMNDPRQCKIDVGTLDGLSDVQKTALKKIYGETRNKQGVIYPGQPFGGEGDGSGWPLWIVGANQLLLAAQKTPSLRFAFGTEMFKYFVFNDPAWDYSRYDFADFRKNTAKAAEILNATNPNLDKFKSRGHKLVIWHGWADPALTPLASIKYYEQVEAHDKKAREFARMFMMPGVLHCAGGAGPDRADWTAVIDDWVEKGQAPERVIASKVTAGTTLRTRPLCVYPQRAVYSGTGNIDDEKNFVCK
ncbi:MAG: tannase/feruloyl esterase family alpha/beta hydrolase [Vicinamibacterales bacterium]